MRTPRQHCRAGWRRLATLCCLMGAGLGAPLSSFGADGPPPLPVVGNLLNRWRFDDTNWLSFRSNAPLAFTNLSLVPAGNTNALEVDNAAPAFPQYREIEPTGRTNLTCFTGSIACWFKPNWASTNLGGAGPATWGRIVEMGTCTTNASVGWWSICLDPSGSLI